MGEDKGEGKKEDGKGFISEDRKKIGDFYNFGMDNNKLQQIQKRSRFMMLRFAITGLVFGFFTEWLLGNGKIYDNIIKKTTMRRLSISPITQTPRRRKTIDSKHACSTSSS
jgi:hypothetical protein